MWAAPVSEAPAFNVPGAGADVFYFKKRRAPRGLDYAYTVDSYLA